LNEPNPVKLWQLHWKLCWSIQ